ncbi:MAG TPA: AAA family ATPase, partial [Dongiaceae bacterium]
MSVLPVEPAYRLAERADEHRWLVTGLWSDEAVGIVGGEPKCCKSFLALDLAVSVASGAPCLRRFVVPRAGRVLLYAAEDALHIVRRRLDGIAAAAGPGLIGGVIVGLTTAKAIALAHDKPLLAVNHLEAHALTARLTDGIAFPFCLFLASGGHTQILGVRGVGDYLRLGGTVDDAIGEAFDKTAKLLG